MKGSLHLDKAPDAFRTISEVADDLEIPQHVLRFWETRFTQIKPMKRSGGRRYYRPDDVDLLKGIRRLLYGEGYTIRGVQRILKEQGIKSVQGLIDGVPPPAFKAIEGGPRSAPSLDLGDEVDDDVSAIEAEEEDDLPDVPVVARREPVLAAPLPSVQLPKVELPKVDLPRGRMPDASVLRIETAPAPVASAARKLDLVKLQAALADLVACRQLIDSALKDG